MRKLALIPVFIIFLAACSPQETPPVEVDIPDPTAVPVTAVPNTAVTETQVEAEPAQETPTPMDTAGPNCLGDDINPLAQGIADDYPFASYEQVMTYFCNGAAFEDILVALETESQTGFSAAEMLEWLSQGFSWEDIWQHLDITD